MTTFRNEMFDLCKKINSINEFASIRQVMKQLLTCQEHESFCIKQDIAHNGVRLHAQFHGILLAFENKITVTNTELTPQVDLNIAEKQALCFGDFYLTSFVDACLSEIAAKNSIVAKMINPYSKYVQISQYSIDGKVDLSVYDPAVKAFKATSVYKYVMHSNILEALKSLSDRQMMGLMGALEREILNTPINVVPNEVLAVKLKEQNFAKNKRINAVDGLTILSYKLLALREMLYNAIHLLYDAILDNRLWVIDTNNLINIEKQSKTMIYDYKTVLIQGAMINPNKDTICDIVLFDIDCEKTKIHEFGSIRNYTFKFDHIEGTTSKVTFCVLDEELNPIYLLTR